MYTLSLSLSYSFVIANNMWISLRLCEVTMYLKVPLNQQQINPQMVNFKLLFNLVHCSYLQMSKLL